MRIGNFGWLVVAVVDAMAGDSVPIHLTGSHRADQLGLHRARLIASTMFEAAGVAVVWKTGEPRGVVRCCQIPVVVHLQTVTPETERPGALAFAFPHEQGKGGITILYDRIAKGRRRFERVLAHVIVHEVVHILQGVVRHSDTGLMKEFWTPEDYRQMEKAALTVTAYDVELIQLGLRKRGTVTAR